MQNCYAFLCINLFIFLTNRCCDVCGKVLHEDLYTDEPSFVKGAGGEVCNQCHCFFFFFILVLYLYEMRNCNSDCKDLTFDCLLIKQSIKLASEIQYRLIELGKTLFMFRSEEHTSELQSQT